tara:strand:+ start:103 stop:324 length:222 start_codon:yes stop_codon:yes gene_type:complete
LVIFSGLKFFKYFSFLNIDSGDQYKAFAENRRSNENLFRVLTAVNLQNNSFLDDSYDPYLPDICSYGIETFRK